MRTNNRTHLVKSVILLGYVAGMDNDHKTQLAGLHVPKKRFFLAILFFFADSSRKKGLLAS